MAIFAQFRPFCATQPGEAAHRWSQRTSRTKIGISGILEILEAENWNDFWGGF